jgi:hypothetical protein
MKTRFGRLAALGLASALAVSLGGCVDNNTSIFIQQVPLPDPEDHCNVSNDPSASLLPAGFVDRSLATGKWQHFLVGNQLITRGNEETLRTETSAVQFYELESEVFDFGGTSLTSFTVPVAGFAWQSTSGVPGYGFVEGTVIDPATLAIINTAAAGQTVVARVRVYGLTLGGLEVETGPWDWPVYVCGEPGKLSCIPGYVRENADDPIDNPCMMGQDTPHDCDLIPYPPKGHWCNP